MTRRESAIISAYTGILCGPIDAMHEYIQELMDRPVWTHELGNPQMVEQIKEKARPDFIQLCQNVV